MTSGIVTNLVFLRAQAGKAGRLEEVLRKLLGKAVTNPIASSLRGASVRLE